MEWSQESATNAYLDTLKLMKDSSSCGTAEPRSAEFISALAAGMSAKLMVEVTSEVSPSTVALAAAARQTGGKLVCILPELTTTRSQQVIEESGLNDRIEFKTGDPIDVLPNYENIDFSLVDCTSVNNWKVLQTLDVNPGGSLVVAHNLVEGKIGLGGHFKRLEKKFKVRSTKHPIGKGMEITMIGTGNKCGKGDSGRGNKSSPDGKGGARTDKSKWIIKVDEKSGEEHIYRVSRAGSFDAGNDPT